jgi:hypothetical protein
MSKDSLLKEYIGLLLNEGWYLRNLGNDDSWDDRPSKKSEGILQRVKDMFLGVRLDAEEIAESWLEDQSLSRDIEIDQDFKTEVITFAKSKSTKVMNRARGNTEKAALILKRALSSRYSRRLD